jgi:hypothetical protein
VGEGLSPIMALAKIINLESSPPFIDRQPVRIMNRIMSGGELAHIYMKDFECMHNNQIKIEIVN